MRLSRPISASGSFSFACHMMANNIPAVDVTSAATLQMIAKTPSVLTVTRSDMLRSPVLTRSFVVYARNHPIELAFVLILGFVSLLLPGRLPRTLLLDRNKNLSKKFNRNNPYPRVTSLLSPPLLLLLIQRTC